MDVLDYPYPAELEQRVGLHHSTILVAQVVAL